MIIPSLIHLGSADAVVQRALRLRGTDFAPFRLIIASTGGCVELISDGSAIRCRGAVLPGRIAMFTSSGLGDQLVEAARLAVEPVHAHARDVVVVGECFDPAVLGSQVRRHAADSKCVVSSSGRVTIGKWPVAISTMRQPGCWRTRARIASIVT